MTEVNRIVEQMQFAFHGKAWHGPALLEALVGVGGELAGSKPFPHAHSIWEIVLHISAWHKFVMRRMAGEEVVEIAEEEDWPVVATASEPAWQKTLHELKHQHEKLCAAVACLHDSDLTRMIRGGEGMHSLYILLHGVIQHDLYHTGQIVLLKKASQS